MTNLFNPPPTATLPISLGKDVVVVFRNKVPGSDPAEYEDYPLGVVVTLAIGKGSSEIRGIGTIAGSTATCHIQSTLADKVRSGAFWRVIVSSGTSDDVPLNGKVVRADGA